MCLEQSAYPTVLIYEKVEDNSQGEGILYKERVGFSRVAEKLVQLQDIANQIELWQDGQEDEYEKALAEAIKASGSQECQNN